MTMLMELKGHQIIGELRLLEKMQMQNLQY